MFEDLKLASDWKDDYDDNPMFVVNKMFEEPGDGDLEVFFKPFMPPENIEEPVEETKESVS